MTRQMVHLSKDVETAINVGKRHGKPVIFEVDTDKLLKSGHRIFISENKVYLTDLVPLDCLHLRV